MLEFFFKILKLIICINVLINVVQKKWSCRLNGYIDYLINVSSWAIFFQFKGATTSTN